MKQMTYEELEAEVLRGSQEVARLMDKLHSAHETLKLFVDTSHECCSASLPSHCCVECGMDWPCNHELARREVGGESK